MESLLAMGAAVGEKLKARGDTVTVAESSTGGLISAALLAVPGASAYYRGGSVVYTMESRRKLIEITARDVEGLAPMTEPMAARFAEVARRQLDSTWGLAELGVAGPTGARYGTPPGSSVIAVDGPTSISDSVQTGSNEREANMWAFAERALGLLLRALDD